MEESNFYKVRLSQSVIDNSPDIFFLKDTGGRYLKINRKFESMFGCTREELIGKTDYDLFPFSKADAHRKYDIKVIETGSPIYIEEKSDFKDDPRFFVIILFPFFSDDGVIYGVCGILHDFTELKKAENEITKSKAILDSALESITDSVSIYDLDSRLIEVNDAFARFYKFRNKEECFRTIDEYPDLFETRFPDGTIAPIGMWAGPRAQRGEKAVNAEYIIIRKDTGEKWIANYSFGPIIDSEKNIIGSVVVGRDVTEQKRMEESLRRNSLELSELNAMKDKLLSIISHDLKNPFTVLLGYIDMILNDLDKYGKDKIRELLMQLENSAKGAYAILENLSEWSRLQSGTMLFNPVEIELKKLFDDNISIFSTYAQSKKIKLYSEPVNGRVITADIHMIGTVIRNLVENAIKFTGESGEVIISAAESENDDIIIVRDTGTGIPADRIGDLFRIDVQYSTMGTSHEKGTGLGLVICREFVEKHEGRIVVESAEGKGSIFTIILPKIKKAADEKKRQGDYR